MNEINLYQACIINAVLFYSMRLEDGEPVLNRDIAYIVQFLGMTYFVLMFTNLKITIDLYSPLDYAEFAEEGKGASPRIFETAFFVFLLIMLLHVSITQLHQSWLQNLFLVLVYCKYLGGMWKQPEDA